MHEYTSSSRPWASLRSGIFSSDMITTEDDDPRVLLRSLIDSLNATEDELIIESIVSGIKNKQFERSDEITQMNLKIADLQVKINEHIEPKRVDNSAETSALAELESRLESQTEHLKTLAQQTTSAEAELAELTNVLDSEQEISRETLILSIFQKLGIEFYDFDGQKFRKAISRIQC